MFKIKDEKKPELQTAETTKLVGSTKKWRDKTKKGEHLPSLEVVKVFLAQFNFVDNQCQ